MNEGTIVVRYAKALYQTAKEDSKTEKVNADVLMLISVIKESEEFIFLLESPVIKVSEKEKLISTLFSKQVDPLVLNFLLLLIKNRREQLLPDMCRVFSHLYKVDKGIKEGTLTTAKQLSKSHFEDIKKYLAKKFKLNIDLQTITDPSLIGGFKLRIEDQQIDASISTKLKKIKTELNHT